MVECKSLPEAFSKGLRNWEKHRIQIKKIEGRDTTNRGAIDPKWAQLKNLKKLSG